MSYQRKYPTLFTPFKIGKLTLRNRIIAAPTSLMWIPADGHLTPEVIAYYEAKAKGGAAIVTLGESIVHSETGMSHNTQPRLDDPTVITSLAQLAIAIKRHGAIPNIELSHGGKFGGLVSLAGDLKEGRIAYGPDDEILPEGPVKAYPEELILEIIESFGKGAAVAKRAGFKMCMLHAGHGWFFGQFLSPRTNHRTDRFGGSLENRCRALIMALESIRKYTGPDFPIEVRMSGTDFMEGGITFEEGLATAKLIEDKCDLINVSAGIHENLPLFIKTHPNMFLEHGSNVWLAEAIRKEVKVPISTVGGLSDPAMMEDIIASGKADLVELGRQLVADPELPNKASLGLDMEINPCLRCQTCFGESVTTTLTRCSVNPVAGNEFNVDIIRSLPVTPKKVFIVGGGPGGMQAAIAAADRGHDVILCEKTGKLGGALNFAQYVDFKLDLYKFEQHLEYMLGKSKVTVLMNTEATPELVSRYNPDVVMVAVGAVPIIPRIPGIDRSNVVLPSKIYGIEDKLGENVVVLGGGLVGCETAAHLGRMGKKVTIVEMRDGVAIDANLFHKTAVYLELEARGVKIETCKTGQAVNDAGLVCTDIDGKEITYQADTVINAVGSRADTATVEKFANCAPVVKIIGDCNAPSKVTDAVFDGYYQAMDI